MRSLSLVLCLTFLQVSTVQSQVLSPAEIKDETAKALQEKYFVNLKSVAVAVSGHAFPEPFYLSRVLDVSEIQQPAQDQRSIQFDRFQGKLILKITGNYFASYPADVMDREQRARQTFDDVMMPILRAAVTQFRDLDELDSYALEISHHIRKKVLGVVTEGIENVVLVLPRAAALELMSSQDVEHQNLSLLAATAFVDGKRMTFWPTVDTESDARLQRVGALVSKPALPEILPVIVPATTSGSPVGNATLGQLQERYHPDLERMVRELDAQAHFVTYAAPAFIDFHKGRYLQLSVVTTLSGQVGGSQYQIAALSFDQHIAHLIRPVLAYIKDAQDFDGIDFSASIRFNSGSGTEPTVAVEYLCPLTKVKSYAEYDSTGQQLLDGSFVLINGERVGLNLQSAENR